MLVSKTKYNELVKYVVESYNKELEEERETLNYILEKKGRKKVEIFLDGIEYLFGE